MREIITAFATPPGASGLAVLRIAGPGAAALADRIFSFGKLPAVGEQATPARAQTRRKVARLSGYQAAFGYVHEADNPVASLDQCVLTRFRAPWSYTGEEQVEISIHGGPALRRALLEIVISAGARPAEAGEFSKWAFLNGKMDLAQAEAVMDLIQADTERQHTAAMRQLQGTAGLRLAEVQNEIYALLSALEVDIEYPEYEDFHLQQRACEEGLERICRSLRHIAAGNRQGRILRDNLQVVLVGEPNVGKSSLLNALAGEERAIVTEFAGTTRDIIELRIDLAGIPVSIYDTAGIRESQDPVERLGVDRTVKLRETADLLMLVVSAANLVEIPDQVANLLGSSANDFLLLCNKIDLTENLDKTAEWQQIQESIKSKFPAFVAAILVSATQGWGIDELKTKINDYYEGLSGSGSADVVLTSVRQQRLLEEALELFSALQDDLASLPTDILTSGIRQGAELLGEITGEDVSEQMVEEIFARFCIGK